MSSRWNALPSSDQEQQHLAATTTTTPSSTTLDSMALLRARVGGFIREEIADAGRSICYYQHLDSDQPLPFLCDTGCCSNGCCAGIERQREYNPYSWALALLAILLLTIFVSLIALLILYWVNKRQTREMRREMMGSHATESSNASQISGPGSYYYPDGFYSYGGAKEAMHY